MNAVETELVSNRFTKKSVGKQLKKSCVNRVFQPVMYKGPSFGSDKDIPVGNWNGSYC